MYKLSKFLRLVFSTVLIVLGCTIMMPTYAAGLSTESSDNQGDGLGLSSLGTLAACSASLGALMVMGKTVYNRYWIIKPIDKALADDSQGHVKHIWNWRERTKQSAERILEEPKVMALALINAARDGDIPIIHDASGQSLPGIDNIISSINAEIETLGGYAIALDGIIGWFTNYQKIYQNACEITGYIHDRDPGSLNLIKHAQQEAIDRVMAEQYAGWNKAFGYFHWNYDYAVAVRWKVDKYLRRLYALRAVLKDYSSQKDLQGGKGIQPKLRMLKNLQPARVRS